jgi:hypothetical protein
MSHKEDSIDNSRSKRSKDCPQGESTANRTWFDNENGVVRICLVGDSILEEEEMRLFFKQVEALLEKHVPKGSPRLLIADLSQAKTSKMMKRSVRRQFLSHTAPLKLDKVAYIKTNPVARMFTKALQVLGENQYDVKGKVDFFDTDEDALVWLKSE